MWAIGEPSGPIENGTTYIVRPRIEPLKSALERLAHLRRVAPVVRRAGVLLALGADEGAVLDAGHVAGIGAREVGVRALRVREALEGSGARPARSQSWSYSSAEPSHQWMASGWVSSATSSTQASSRWWVVGAVVVCVTGLAISLGHAGGPQTVSHLSLH